MIKLGNKTIGNACLGDKQLSAVFLGDKLIWSAGITLKATDLGRYGMVDLGDLVWSYQSGHQRFSSGTLASVIKPCDSGVIPNLYAEGFVAEKLNNMSVGGTDKSMSVYTNSYVFAKDAGYTDATLFRNSLKGKYLIYELATPTSDKLSDLTAVQLYNLLTLNGTDFTNLEKLADGYAVKIGEFKMETTKTIDLGTLNWTYDGINFKGTAISGIYAGLDAKPNMSIDGYETETTREVAYDHLKDKVTTIYPANTVLIRDTRYTDVQSFKNAINGVKLTYELALSVGIKGTRYGIVDLGSLTWTYQSASSRFYAAMPSDFKKPTNNNETPNAYVEKYEVVAYGSVSDGKMAFAVSGNVFYYTTDSTDLPTGFLVYELATPLGSKLDNYTAEQAYNLLIGTVPSTKLPYPNGVKFEMKTTAEADLGTLNWTRGSDGRFYSNGLKDTIARKANTEPQNMALEGYTAVIYSQSAWTDKSISQNGDWIWINDSSFTDATALKNHLSGKYLTYELAMPTVIKGTKYGIVDLGTMNFGSVASDNPIRTASTTLKGIIKGMAWATEITNSYIAGFEAKTGSQAYGTNNAKSFGVDSVGTFYLTDPAISGFNYSQVQAYLKGKYLIFELATPDGSDYSDLTAKQMFDLINTDKLAVLANGKSFDGNKSLLGKQNTSGSFTQANLNLYPKKDGGFKNAFNADVKTIERKANHKYFLCVNIETDATGERLLGLWDSSSSGYGADNRSSASVSGDCSYCIISPTTTANASVPTFQFLSMTYAEVKYALVIDLTELGLANLTAEQAYQHFKEYNLDKLKTENLVKVGGYVK